MLGLSLNNGYVAMLAFKGVWLMKRLGYIPRASPLLEGR